MGVFQFCLSVSFFIFISIYLCYKYGINTYLVPKLFQKVQFGIRIIGMFNLVPNFLKRFNLVFSVKLELTPCVRTGHVSSHEIFIFIFSKKLFFFQKN